MKINNVSNINALLQDAIKGIPEKPALGQAGDAGRSPLTSSLTTPIQSQISQLLSLINLFPLFYQFKPANTQLMSLHSQLAKAWMPPTNSKEMANWLAGQEADKALLKALTGLTQLKDEEGGSNLKALLMLVAEQRLNEQTKGGEYHWLFPFRQQEQTPVNVSAKKKYSKKHQRQVWSVTVNLTLSNNRHLTATAELDGESVSLSFITDAAGLQQQLEAAFPTLEKALARHHIALSSCDVSTRESATPDTLHSGVDIQV